MSIARNCILFAAAFITTSISGGCMKRDRVPETRDADVPNLPESSFETSKGTQLPRGYIPQYAREEAQLFTKEFLAQNSKSASGLKHRFFYNEKGEACLEYTVTPKHGYIWDTPTWTGSLWGSITGSISGKNIYYTQTKKNQDETYYSIEKRRKDSAFREIEKIVLQIATEYDYDFYAYNGQTVKYRDPNVKKAVCDGYADAVVRAFANHRLVQKTEKWTSEKGNHAWNVIALKDGREIYCDATWYDGNSIDDNGYVVHIPAQNPVDLTFDEAEFNSLGGAVDKTTGGLLAVHFAWNDAVLVN